MNSSSVEPMETEPIFSPICTKEELALDQAAVFLEDAISYRSIHHKIDRRSLRIYRFYYSAPVRWGLILVIFVDLMLAFLETPSSLTVSSDPRYMSPRPEVPCGILETIELLCLSCFVFDVVIKTHVIGKRQFFKNRWLLSYMLVLVISFADVFVSLSYNCGEVVRIRRILRPFFLLQNSSLMKKLLRAIKRTLPEIMSVLFLLFLHIVFFTSFGMLLFPRESWTSRNQTDVLSECRESNTESGSICEGAKFFPNLQTSMRSLFVLLTTANNPDVMMPAYMKNRFYAIYFIVYSGIGLYCFLNMLTAVIYNQFRGYLMTSLQSSLFRRRLAVRAAFEVLNRLSESKENVSADSVSSNSLYRVLEKVHVKHRHQQLLREGLDDLPSGHVTVEEFQSWFEAIEKPRRRNRPAMSYVTNPLLRKLQVVAAHHWFDYFGDFISAVNVVFVSIELDLEYDLSLKSSHSALAAANLFFVIYYCAEQSIKLWALGWQRYVSFKGNLYCGGVTVLLVVIEIIHLSLFGSPFNYAAKMPTTTDADYIFSLPNMVRIINMLIIFRLLRVVPNISALSLVAETLLNLVRNLIPFIGIIAAIYYIFAIFGMMLFEGVTNPLKRCAHTNANATSDPCTELDFDKFQYFANNFDDFAAALVNLWDIMIVNNWHVFLKAYEKLVNPWAQLYFLAWYLVSVIMIINLFVALILEAFVSQWEQQQARLHKHTLPGSLQSESQDLRFHQLFRSSLVEPHEAELIAELNSHEYLRFHPSYGTL